MTSGFDKWKEGLAKAPSDPQWHIYDCDIKAAVSEFNHHLGGTASYSALDWQMIKAMLWVESGAAHAQWKIKPMQIGVDGDPGMAALLERNGGGDLILPPSLAGRMSSATIRSSPPQNIRAGIGYLLLRMANFEHKSMRDTSAPVKEVPVKSGDSLDRIARNNDSTLAIVRELNPSVSVLQVGQLIKVQKGETRMVVTSWRLITTNTIAQRYNGGGDPNYARKLDYALSLVRNGSEAVCN